MTKRLSEAVIEAAGGVVERPTADGLRIAVIYRERYGPEWALPKGKRQPNESWQRVALREVREETGVTATITGVAGAAAYLADGVPKIVLYWRMRADNVPAFTPNEETKALEWLTPENAIQKLSHREEINVVLSLASSRPK